MAYPGEDLTAEERHKIEQDFVQLRVKVCSQVESAAHCGHTIVTLQVADVRELLHVLAIRPYKVLTMQEARDDLQARKRRIQQGEVLD